MSEKKYCAQCGNETDQAVNFCEVCGYQFNQKEPAEKETVSTKPVRHKSRKPMFVLLGVLVLVGVFFIMKPLFEQSFVGTYRATDGVEEYHVIITQDKDGYVATHVQELPEEGLRIESTFPIALTGNGNRYKYDPRELPKLTFALNSEYALKHPSVYDEYIMEALFYGYKVEETTDEYLISKFFHDLEEYQSSEGYMIDYEMEFSDDTLIMDTGFNVFSFYKH